MNKILLLIFSILLLSFYGYAASDEKNTDKPLEVNVGYISDVHTQGSCSCTFYWPSDEKNKGKNIFSSNFSDEIWMNLNGRDVRLELINSVHDDKNRNKGSRFYEIYQRGKMEIRVDYLVTWTCVTDAPNNKECEETHFDIKITFSQNGLHKIVKAKGVCGC